MSHRQLKTFSKNDYLFLWHKFRVFGTYALAFVGPTMYFTINFSQAEAFFYSWLANMVVLYWILSSDEPENLKDLKYLIMRRRHFDKINEKEEP